MGDKDYLSLTAEEFGQLEAFQLREALQLFTGYMAVAQQEMRDHSAAHHQYLASKENFVYLKSMATTLQTLIRAQ
jgi:hypothetical protein